MANTTLAEYVRDVMGRKRLTAKEVERRSAGKIKDSYVSHILKGKAKNPSIPKLVALAQGLGIDAYELIRVAGRLPEKKGELWNARTLVMAMDRILDSPELSRLVKHALKLKPARLKSLVASLGSDKET